MDDFTPKKPIKPLSSAGNYTPASVSYTPNPNFNKTDIQKPVKKTLFSHNKTSKKLFKTPENLQLNIKIPKILRKAIDRYMRLPFWLRVFALVMAVIMLGLVFIEISNNHNKVDVYSLGRAETLLKKPVELYSEKLQLDKNNTAYRYNPDYKPSSGVIGESVGPKFSADFATNPNDGVTITDPVNGVSMTIKPDFKMLKPIKDTNRLVYPMANSPAKKVYSVGGAVVKEDILLNEYVNDKMTFDYDLELADYLEPRIEKDGSLGVYGPDNKLLLGQVSTGTDKDAKLLESARNNAKKTTLVFRLPAPFIIENGKKLSTKASAKFTLEGKKLTLSAVGLKEASYPLSIDPSVYIESASRLMRGNNETNIDFDIDNELIQKSQTTGARIDAWSSTTNLSNAVWGQGTAVAGGYIYSAGGVGSGSTVTSTYDTSGTSTFAVPAGVTNVTIKAWGGGAGGGAGNNGTGVGGNGGGGGYAKAVISVTPGEDLTVRVGAGGTKASANQRGGNGGEASKVSRSATILLEAGAGGGGGGRRGNTTGTEGDGGAGGGSTGQQGRAGSTGPPGLGGSQVAGGIGGNGTGDGAAGASQGGGNAASTGSCATNASGTGSSGTGGTGGIFTTTCAAGGGGGGGYYGGGGGASTNTSNRSGGGGGGGSSYINPTGLIGGTDVNTVGSYRTPGNDADSDRGGLADGGAGASTAAAATDGENGIVVISYTTTGSVSNSVSWAKFNTTTNAIESPNPGNGACGGWCSNGVYNLPTALTGLSLTAYNGYLYAIGGSNSGGTPQTSVYIVKLGANGEPQKWHPTDTNKDNWVYWYRDNDLSNARSKFATVAYKNKIYILGGLTTSNTVLGSNTVQSATINPTGTLSAWTSSGMQALTTARYGLTAHVYNDVLYAIGGNATFSGTPVGTVEYSKLNNDGTMNSWVASSSLVSSGRLTGGGSFSTVFGGYMYVAGGCTAVNASGYCTAISSDVQLASINADGSLAEWNTIIGLTNDRFAHTLIAWQGGLYRLGGCRAQDGASGSCTNTVLDVDYGVINPDGEASTVASSSASGAGTCAGSDPYYCDSPASIGNMLNASAVVNGYLYVMGGCTNNDCSTRSSGVTYQAIGSDGRLQRPSSCAGTFTDSYCVSSSSLPTALASAGVTVFNNRIYVVGGFPTIDNIYYVSVNYDGSLGVWQNNNTNTGTTTTADAVTYTFAYARANPNAAGSNPGNLYIFGGCSTDDGGSIAGIGCSGYSSDVFKCNITTTGTVTGCTTTGQLQIGTVTGNDDLPTAGGLGAHAGAVYANYIYLMGGLSTSIANNGTDLTRVRYAKFDDSNNVVAVSGSDWVEGANEMNTGRRRGAGFGYNGFLYVLGGYDGADAIADIEFAKINVSDGSWEIFDTSSVTIQKRWALSTVVSNSYAYVIGGCIAGHAPSNCSSRTNTIQTFQIYNNNSGAPINYTRSTNQFATDRFGAGTAIYNGYIYVAGGCISTSTDCDNATDNVQFAKIDVYGNIEAWNNTTDSTLPGERAHGKLLESGGTLYWVGGQNDGGTAQSDVYYAVPDAGTGNIAAWGTASNVLPAARSKFGAASWNGRLYITGGVNGSGTLQNSVYVSPALSRTVSGGNITSAFTSSTAFDVARSGTTAVAYANNLYVFGGYDGTNYLSDAQFTQINSDGTVDPWTFTTSLPGPLSQADGFAANGYLYIVGGRSSNTSCVSKTLVSPISANTTIATGNNPTGVGEWFETNVRYEGQRYANSVAYANGKYYTSGGVCNGFPTVSNRLSQNFNTATTAHSVTMPSTVESGDLLLTLFTNDGNATVTTPAGWTAPTNSTQTRGANARGSVFAKVADGTEDSTSVNFVTSATEEGSAQVYRIKAGDWYGAISGVEVANSGDPGATTTTPNPPSLNPGGWGAENTLWIAYGAGSSYTAVNSYPTNYSSGAHNLSNTGTAGASASSTWREANAASEDPGNFTMSTNSDGVAFTIAIRPVAFGLTGANKVVQTAVYSQPQVAQYSRLIDTDTNVFPTKWLMNGLDNSIGAKWQAMYKSAYDASNVINHQSFDDGTNGVVVTEGNSSYDNCFEAGSATLKYSNAQYVTPGLSARLEVPTGNGTAACQDDHTATTVRYDRFYVRFDSFASLSGLMSLIEYYNTSNSTNVADVRVSTTGELRMRDNFITEATSAALAANTWHRIETSVSNDQLTLRTFEGANLNGTTPTQAFTINLNGSPTNNFNRSTVGIVSNISANWGMYIDEHKVSSSNWVGPAYPGWGQTTNFGDVTLGQPENYIPLDASGADTEFARWYFFSINIDASRTFGYPEDVNRGPTISDLSLFFTADPSKRLRHGKTFTGGEQQPLDTPFP